MSKTFSKELILKKIDSTFYTTYNKSFTKIGSHKHNKTNNHLLKAGRISNREMCKKDINWKIQSYLHSQMWTLQRIQKNNWIENIQYNKISHGKLNQKYYK